MPQVIHAKDKDKADSLKHNYFPGISSTGKFFLSGAMLIGINFMPCR
jgi:hypothetical protein